MFRIIVIVYTD